MRLSTALKGAAVLGVALSIALIAAVKAIDFNKYKDFLAQQVKAATGRELTIAGQLELKPGLVPLVVANGVTLANVAGGSRPEMIKVERIEAEIALLPLLKREVRVQRLILSAPDILLEKDNWALAGQAPAIGQPPAKTVPLTRFSLRELKIKNARVAWRDAAGGGDGLNLHKLTIQPDQGPAGLLAVSAAGNYRTSNYEITGKVGGTAALAAGKPFPVQLKGTYHGIAASLEGSIADPLRLAGLDVKLAVQGDETAELTRLAGHALPSVGPFKLAARLTGSAAAPALADVDAVLGRRDAALVSAKGSIRDLAGLSGLDLIVQAESDNLAGLSRLAGSDIPSMGPARLVGILRGGGGSWTVADLRATLAGSDLAGDISLALGPHPLVHAKLHSTLVALADFTTPAAKPGEKFEPKGARTNGDRRLFSANKLPVELLRGMEGEVNLHVGRLVTASASLTDVTAGLRLADQRLVLAPFSAVMGGGTVDGGGVMSLDGRAPRLAMRMAGRGIQLGQMAKEAGSDLLSGGKAEFRVEVTAAGASLRELAATASGGAQVVVGEGRIHNRAVDWAGGDLLLQVLGALNPLARTDDTTQMSCAAVHLSMRDGVATADRSIAVETAKVDVVGTGTIDLRDETLDLGFTPRARDGLGLSLGGTLAGMTRLRGTLAQPAMAVDELGAARAAASAGAAIATGGLSLLGELLFDKVTAESSPCASALGQRPAKAKSKAR